MLYCLDQGELNFIGADKIELKAEKKYIAVVSYNEAAKCMDGLDICRSVLIKSIENKSSRFESHEDMDILCIPKVDFVKLDSEKQTLHLFIKKSRFYIVCEEPAFVQNIFREISEDDTSDVSFGRLLYDFFEKIFQGNREYLDDLEEKIMDLEKEVILDKKRKNYVTRIIVFRKHLVKLKRYYEQFQNIFNYIEVNENGMFDKRSLKMLKILADKTDRLHGTVLNLIEYITQIREVYQAEVDINLNTTMKLFTVVTTIFFPLTLIAGWYGMNFDMPEYQSAFGYPFVIFISLAIVVISIGYFKKNKWF